ncbi:carboxypeptidase-like regulatory domain-containing protein [Aureispira sp. CCB-E]|uniref:carboxypeptidase-like regulatory domain-containing protein n=1 Tax=Aureispira sp. CCB-E TaxID=3051121 RepID=UPI0028696979|nr:carboxypeptidase-like regulatory domain-containing protein [Aureispira sp. CCB-E]WMX13640.1 carboxypeptidase-like regulatory domain-containing protein [Aureispira sp. CCB-E]
MKPPLSKIVLLFIVLLYASSKSYAQQINLSVKAKPLGEVLGSLHQEYDVQVSFNAQLLNECLITVDQQFESPNEVLEYLTKLCNFKYRVIDGVFVISKKRSISKEMRSLKQKYTYQGKIIDKENKGHLPYATVLIDNTRIVTDVEGNFTYQSEENKAKLLVSYLGYFVKDTLVKAKRGFLIELAPSITELQEVTVFSNQKIKTINSEDRSGLAKLNNRQTLFLPGNNKNSLFSFLRLQPGVMASGEQNNGYILWGGQKGETHILFDGITIFNTSNYNNKIGAINPLLIQDIEILKGGYNVEIGDRLGGVVNITSKPGNVDTSTTELLGTHNSFNAYMNLDLKKQSSLQLGIRIVVPDIFASINIRPTAFFSDLTVRYAKQFKDGSSLRFTSLVNVDASNVPKKHYLADYWYINQFRLSNLYGGNLNYIKPWKNIGQTQFSLAYSEFMTDYYVRHYDLYVNGTGRLERIGEQHFYNSVREVSAKVVHRLPASRYHQLSFGLNFTYNSSLINHGILKRFEGVQQKNNRLGAYVKDDISFSKWFTLRLGIRADLPLESYTKLLIQPRIEAIFTPVSQWKINLAHGVYNQFLSETTIVDVYRNYTYHWSLTNNKYHPVPQATHTVIGVSGRYKYWNCRLEAYYRRTKNTLQYWGDSNNQIIETSFGKHYNYGVDVKFGAHYKNQQIWLAYTLSKAEVQLNKNQPPTRAPQDQRHEFKVAGMFNVGRFFWSINYVYGSGFPNKHNLTSNNNIRSYSRLDIGSFYRFRVKELSVDFGCSVLNVLNTYNIQYNNWANFLQDGEQYIQAMPRNFTFFVHFKF